MNFALGFLHPQNSSHNLVHVRTRRGNQKGIRCGHVEAFFAHGLGRNQDLFVGTLGRTLVGLHILSQNRGLGTHVIGQTLQNVLAVLNSVGKNQHLSFGRRADHIRNQVGQQHETGLEVGQFVDHIGHGHDTLRVLHDFQKLWILGLEFLDLHTHFGIRDITGFRSIQNGTQDPFHDKHQAVFAFRSGRQHEHLLAGNLGDGLHEDLRSNVVAFIDNYESNALEGFLWEVLHGQGLEHGNHHIAAFDFNDIPLDTTNPSPREESTNPIFPLIPEERVMNEDKSRNPKLCGDVQSAHGFPTSRRKRQNAVFGHGFEVGIDNILLLWTKTSLELPEFGGSLGHISRGCLGRTVLLNPVGFGHIELVLGFEEDGLLGDAVFGHEDGRHVGLDGEGLAELRDIAVRFGESISMESEGHTSYSLLGFASIFGRIVSL